MTQEEKAEELFNKFCIYPLDKKMAKHLAILSIDEVINVLHKQRKDFTKTSQLISSFRSAKDFDDNLKHIRKELDSYIVSEILYMGGVKHYLESF